MSCRMLFMDDWSCWEKIDGLLFLDHSDDTVSLNIEQSNIISP